MTKKLFRLLVLSLLVAVLAAGCFGCKKKADTDIINNTVDEPDTDHDNHENYVVKPSQGNGETETKLKSYNYYTLNSSKDDVVTARSMISADVELTSELIMANFIDSLEDESIILSINGVTVSEQDKSFYLVDFTGSIRDIAADNKEVEELILIAAAQSLIDNLTQCDKVGFLINGEAYSTANRSFAADYIFMDE